MPHILHNGQLLPDSAGVPVQNRGFLFADGIFETIRIAYGQPLFLEDHHQRIREGLKAHRIHAPLGFTPASIRADIRTLLEAEGITGGARVRIVGEDLEIDLTDKAISELLLRYMQPRFVSILRGAE